MIQPSKTDDVYKLKYQIDQAGYNSTIIGEADKAIIEVIYNQKFKDLMEAN